jgi:hypothetical protein
MARALPRKAMRLALGPNGHYSVPAASKCLGLLMHCSGKSPDVLHFQLADGSQLDIPVTPEALGQLTRILTAFAPEK